jgi:DNA topoisomerase VI subunit B
VTNNEIVRALRENANALRRIAQRREVKTTEENELRMIASNIDDVALEFSTVAKQAVLPFGEDGPNPPGDRS